MNRVSPPRSIQASIRSLLRDRLPVLTEKRSKTAKVYLNLCGSCC